MRVAGSVAIALAVLLACAPCCAQKVTVDPNTGAAPADIDGADKRVAQKVSYEAWHKPVKLILADLTKQTGVTLNAGYNKQDWQVRDRRMNVFVKDVTLAELMNSIARVMKFKWSVSHDLKPPTYRLYADRRLIADLQAETSRVLAAIKQEGTRGRTKLLQDFEKIADLSPEQMEKLKTENPYYYVCAETGFAKLALSMFREIPQLKDLFIGADKNLTLPTNLLSEETRRLYVGCATKNWRYTPTDQKLPADYREQLATRDIVIINANSLPDDPSRVKDYGLITTRLKNGPSMHVGDLDNPESKANQWGYKYSIKGAELDGDWARAQAEMNAEMPAAIEAERKRLRAYQVLDPPAEHADEPDLHRSIDLQEQWKKLAPKPEEAKAWGKATDRMQQELAEKAISLASDLSLVADSFATVDIKEVFNREMKDKELLDVLEAFAAGYFCGWEKHGKIVEFRCRDWFHRRGWQIPDEWVERWRRILEQTGTLPLDEYAQLATLDPAQIWENVLHEPEMGRAVGSMWDIGENQGLLRFYLRLDSNQKRMLFADGLDISLLRPDQRQSYADMFGYGFRFTFDMIRFSEPGDRQVTVKAKVDTDADKRRKWFFTVYLEGEDGAADTTFRVPVPKGPIKPAEPGKSQ